MQTHRNDGVQFRNGKPFGQTILKRAFLDTENGIKRILQQRINNRLVTAFLIDVANVFHVHFLIRSSARHSEAFP